MHVRGSLVFQGVTLALLVSGCNLGPLESQRGSGFSSGDQGDPAARRPQPISLARAANSAGSAGTAAPVAPTTTLEERIKEYVSRYPLGDAERARRAASQEGTPEPTSPMPVRMNDIDRTSGAPSAERARPAVTEPPAVGPGPPSSDDMPTPSGTPEIATRADATALPIEMQQTSAELAGVPDRHEAAPPKTDGDPASAGAQSPESKPPTLEAIEVQTTSPLDGNPIANSLPQPLAVAAPPAPANQPVTATGDSAPSLEPVLEALEAAVAENPGDLANQLRLRLLYLMAGDKEQAVAPAEGIGNELAALIASLMKTVAATEVAASDRNAATDEALRAIDEFRELLRAHAELDIPRVALCRRVDSFGVFDEIATRRFAAGQATPVILYCEVKNFVSQAAQGEQYRTLLSQRLEVLTRQGELVWETQATEIEDLSRNRREDFFLAQIVHLPATLNPGHYVLNVTIEDKMGAKSNQKKIDFEVTAGQ